MVKKTAKSKPSTKSPARTTKPTGTNDTKKLQYDPPAPDAPIFALKNIPSRKDAEFNSIAIRTAFTQILQKKNGRRPTYEELSEATGLNKGTVHRHISRLKFEPEKSPFRVLTEDVCISIYRGALKGSSRDKKLWLQLFEGFSEKVDIESGLRGLNAAQARRIEKTMTEDEAAAIYNSQVTGKNDDDD